MAGQVALVTLVESDGNPPTSLGELVDDYLASCQARGLSEATVERAYRWGLCEVFLPWCAANGIQRPDELTQRVLDRFTAHLHQHGGRRTKSLSKQTIHTYIRHVRQFLSWAAREGEVNAAVKPQLPRLPRKVLDVLSRREIDRLEGAATTERNKLMVRILADTGIRLGELCDLNTADSVHRDGRKTFLKVHGKGDRERLVPILPDLARRIERFIKDRPADAKGERLLVSARRGGDGRYAPLDKSGVEQLVRGLAYKAGITKRVYPHIFRHSYATEALRRGVTEIQVKDILGHSSLRMIDLVYAHLNTTDSYAAMLKMLSDAD
jgi:integrase/recombinase XerD